MNILFLLGLLLALMISFNFCALFLKRTGIVCFSVVCGVFSFISFFVTKISLSFVIFEMNLIYMVSILFFAMSIFGVCKHYLLYGLKTTRELYQTILAMIFLTGLIFFMLDIARGDSFITALFAFVGGATVYGFFFFQTIKLIYWLYYKKFHFKSEKKNELIALEIGIFVFSLLFSIVLNIFELELLPLILSSVFSIVINLLSIYLIYSFALIMKE